MDEDKIQGWALVKQENGPSRSTNGRKFVGQLSDC